MAKVIDVQCSVEFASDKDYQLHKKAGHEGHLEKSTAIESPPDPTNPDLPPGVPSGALPTQEFIDQVRRIEEGDPKDSNPSQHPTELPPAEPITLTYRIIGQCPEHRTPVDTLELDVAEKHFVIGTCAANKEQLITREVAKL